MNKVYKIVWNKKINQWVVASELAKGMQNASTSVARVDDNPFNFFKKGFICVALLSALSGASAQSITVNTAAEFRTAVEGGAYDHITLGSNITLTRDIAVNFSQKNNIVIDGNHQYELKVTSGSSNGLRINKGGGTITLQNMSIDTENYYSMVRVESTDPNINVVYDNIKNFSASQHTFMRGGGGNSNAIATMGNMGVVAPVTRQEIGEINKMIFTGQYHVVHSNSSISFQNNGAVINTATMDFKKGADVKIDRTGTTANITNTDNRAFAYTFEDGAKFELIAAQNILLGTNTNRGFRIGTYDAKGFGTGASIILNQTNTGAAYANGIDNATTNTTGINHNATGTDHVVFNLGDETDLRVTGTGISASKTTGSGGIYARNAGKIDADIGMHIEHNNGENGEVVLANQGTITSQTAGIELLSTANKTMKLDGTSGSLTALSGAGIKVGHAPENGDLNLALVGGEINVSEGATGIEFNGNTANAHTITGTTINANGTTSTAIKHNNVNSHITFKDTHINIEDGIGFSDLNNKTFAKGDTGGTNQMTVKGTGTALRLAKDLSQLAGAHLNINVTDHTGVVGTTGAGVGVEITGGAVADVIKVEDGININATGATALKILGTVERELVNQGVITGYIRFDNGDVNNTITNTGAIDHLITHGGDDTLTIDNGASLLGVANLGEGQNKVYINNPSQIHGVTTGSGDDLFELSNIDSNNHVVIINQLDAGAGTNTLNVKDSIFKAQADTKFENFANIHLDKTALTLVASNNIATGTVHIDQLSALTLGDQYTGDFSASVVGDGTVTIDKGATVTLTGTNTGLTGNLTVAAGGTLNTNHLNQFGSGTTEVAGTLNHTANSLQTHLTGAGQLNLTGDQSAFNFDANVGSDFTGNVRLQNNMFNLSGTNTDTLANSTLSLSTGNTTTVEEQNQAVKNLELDGATLVFKDAGSIVTDHLSNTAKDSVIQVDVTDTESVNVIDQNSGVGKQLITANTSGINLDHLSLQDFTGQVLGAGTELEIKQNGHAVAEGTYHYTLKEHHGLALNYGLSKIDIHEDEILELNSTTSTSRVMNAQLTGLGGIDLTSTAAGLTIDNALNDYQGATNVTAGMVTLGSDHALGQTAHLNLATGTTVDLSGHKQTIGGLTNAGSLDIAGGSLTLTGNGTSSAKDGLRGAGQLNIAGGDLSVSAENTNLSANVSIASDSALTLIKNATVGSGHIAIAGALKLQAMDTALSNTMSGAGSINVSDHSDVRLTADNTGFTGTFAIDGTSHLTATDFNQLGSGSVAVAESGIVNLNKITRELTNTISGDGNLNLSGTNLSLNTANTHLKDLTGTLNLAMGSNLTLVENGQLNDAAKVNIAAVGDSVTVNSTGDFNFNNNLVGSGSLDVQTAGNGFNFGKGVGSDFAGIVNVANSTFHLTGDNTAALKNATLVVGKGNTTTVDTENQTIGNLTLEGGRTVFKGKGSIATDTLASNGKSIIQVDLDAIAPTDGTAANLFDQNSGQNHQLITATNNGGLKLSDLTLQGLNGSAVGESTIRNIDQNNQKVAEGTYNYALNKTDGLGISYGLSALNIVDGQTLTLDATSAANKNMTATLTGTGNLTLTSDDQGLTLTNDKNAYTGATNVTAGLVTAGSDNAFGQTSQLNLATGTTVDLNGKTQTIGSLTNVGKVDLAGGTLTISNAGGAASTSSGSLAGIGNLTISVGDLSITSANNDLAAEVAIKSGASVTLDDASTLGTSTVAVDGALSLNASATLANQLTGTGAVNTHADIALTGDNSGFTGAQNIGDKASLTVSNQSALGSGQVNFATIDSKLNLNGVASAVQNVLHGSGIVNIANGSAVNFSNDNKDFAGTFAVDGTSSLTTTDFSQLGKSKVNLASDSHVNLDKMTGEFTNAISGAGSVNLSGTDLSLNAGNTHLKDFTGAINIATGSNLTLAENGQLNDAAKVNIAAVGDSVTVNSTGNFSFNNHLTGSGLLDVKAAGNSFNFGKDVGSDFVGTVNLTNSTLSLSGDNTAALKNATLVIGKGNTTTVDTENQTIGNLTLQEGKTVFQGQGSMITNTLASNGTSIIQVDLDAIAPTDGAAANLFDQNSGQNHQLITANNNDGLKLSDLTLQGLNGNAVGESTIRNIDQNDQKVAEGTYNYALNKTDGLGINYGLSALNIVDGQTLILDSTSAANKNMTATLTGTGNLTLTSDDKGLTLTNDKNAYAGATTITAGLVTAGSDNAFGQTSQLNLAAGAAVDLNGKTQTIGSLTNKGKVNLAGGALTISNANGAASTSSGELLGTGGLIISAGDLSITSVNNDLAASIGIHSGASVTLLDAGTLGTSKVAVDGALNLNANSTLANQLKGTGAVNSHADIVLTGDNSGFTGAQNIGDQASLTVSKQAALGLGQVNFATIDSKLNLNGVAFAVQNALNGAGIVNIANGSAVNFSNDNKDFAGIFAVDGTSALTATAFSQLGKGSVSVVQGGHINLDKMTGELTNAISGAGSVNLSGTDLSLNAGNTHFKDLTGTLNLATGSNLTLAENGQLNDAAKANVASKGDSITVNSTGDFSFNNNLVGSGSLDVQTAGNSFKFGKDVGSDFAGTVNVANSTFHLTGNNTEALKNATLVIGQGNTTTVDTKDQTIGNLTLDGGQAVFKGKGSIATDTLASNGKSIIQVDLDAIAPTDGTAANLFDQNSGQNHQLITAKNTDDLQISDLTLQGLDGSAIGQGTIRNIDQNDQKVAEGTYNYALNKTDGLGINYGLSALNIVDGQTLILDSTSAANKNMTATLTGTGNLTLTSDDQGLTLTNDKNAYTGATNVTAGLVKAGSDHAFGQTSQLNLAAGAAVDLNSKTQTIGSLTNNGQVDFAGGTLTIINANGAVSASSGELTGKGNLTIAKGDLNITSVNNDLDASIGIHSGASVSLSDAGTLGTSTVAVDGALNLNANSTLANQLKGTGSVNTHADIALTGDNSGFTGAQNIGNQASLTVRNQSALGLGQVNFGSETSTLNLNGIASAVQNTLNGAGIVKIIDSAAVNFSDDNKDFAGIFAVDGTSQLTTTDFSQLGSGSVAVAESGIVNLNKITGELANSISGAGNLNLSGTDLSLNTANTHLKDLTGTLNLATGSNLTLAENGQLNDAAKVNIAAVGDSITVNSTGDFSFNNNLVGSGLLNVQTAGNSVNFGKDVGSDFAGTVNLTNSTLSLSGENTEALKNATLVIGKGNTTTVDTENQTIGNLTLDGGQTVFKGKGSLITNMLASDGTSIIQVDLDAIAPTDGTAANLFDQNSGQNHQLITATNNDGLKLSDLRLQGLNGNAVGESTIRNIDQNDQKVAKGTYNYALNNAGGLGISYGLSALNIVDGQTLTLDVTNATNKNMTATLTGTGNLTLTSDDKGLTLTNDKNAYTGATTITAGLVTAGSDNAFGQTSQLNLAAGTTIDLNGKTQTIGSLTNVGKVDLAGGTLTVTHANGAASASSGELTGTGNLTISAGDLSITSVNNDLAAEVAIKSGASVTLDDAGTLGTSKVAVDGALNLNANSTLANQLKGTGAVNSHADIVLTGDNSGFTGAQNIGDQASLTVSKQAALGLGQVNFVTTDSKLKLTGVTSAVQNVLHGSGIVNIANGSAVNFSNDNKDFAGIFAVDGTSQLTTTDFSQLGKGSVSIVQGGAINLDKITGDLTNVINGAGNLNLAGTDLSLNTGNTKLKDLTGAINITKNSNLTLAENSQLNDSTKVNIAAVGDSITVNSSGDFNFNNHLTGSGLLDVKTAGNSFNFGKDVGNDFAGIVNVANSTFHLTGNNTAALKNATLVIGKGNTTTVDTENQTIGSLTLEGGQTLFKGKGSITTDTLASNGKSIIQVDLDAIAPTDGTAANLFDQNSGQHQQLITAKNTDDLQISDLTLQGLDGSAIGQGTIRNVDQNDQKVAEGTYNYALNNAGGLGISYGLSALNIVDGQTLTLDSISAANKNMTATLTGTGNLTLTSDDQGLTLTNDKNAYTGATNVTAGLVKAGSDHAFGQTSQLNLTASAAVDLNGKTQTIGSLTNVGKVDLAGGTLTITNTNGAISTSSGSLVGAGKLAISSGDLSITSANKDLDASIGIHSGASVSLSDVGTLGTSKVAVDGALNLNTNSTLANQLTGRGAVNTNTDIALTGDNSGFTGTQNIGNQASLTVRNQSALGLGQVNFETTDSKLNLNGVASAVQNALNGAGIVNIANGSAVNFSSDNKDFTGIFAVDGTSALTATDFSQLGKGSVSLMQGGTVNLDKITGDLANSISGAGSVNLSGTDLSLNAGNTHLKDLTGAINIATGSNLTLAENGQLNDAAKVNIAAIGNSITVNSKGEFNFNNHLTGSGSLDVQTAGNSFNFGKDVGSDFAGTVNLENTQFNLSGDNAQALQNANLSLGSSNVTTVGAGTQTIGGLTLNGGHLLFNSDKETINTGTLSSTGVNSIVTINTEYIPRVDVNESPNLFDQLTGLVTNIITAKDSSGLNVNDLTLKDQHGKEILDNVHHDIVLNSEKIADSTYNYHLVENKGLGVTYGLVAIDILDGKTLTLDSTTINRGNNKMTAKITGQGNLTLMSDDQGMIVDNSHNAYTGVTNVTAGLVKAGSDNAFGQTSQLNLAAGTTVDLNGKTQTVGSLKNEGKFDLAGGSLTMTEKGSTSSGALMGAGDLIISGGDLNITTANTDLMANVAIHSGAAIQLSETGSLGNGAIDVSGTLDINNGHANFKNGLSGSGKININDNVALTADANTFSGTLNINDKTLSVTSEKQLGTAKIVNHGTVDLNLLVDGRWVNQMTGTGDFIKSGTGTLRVASQLLHTGNTEIKAGAVFLEKGAVLGGTNQKSRASMAGTLNIAQGSTLAGTGTVNQTVNNYGTIDVNLRDVRQSPDRDYAQGNATLTMNHDVNNYNKIYIGNANTTAGNRLIINGNYTAGDNAVLYMNTDLGNQTTSLSDQLIVSGNISGKTKLYVTDIGNVAGGMTSPLGIKIIDAGSSDDNAFELQNTVVKGINEYVLSRNAEDQDWYLTSYRDLYRPDVGSTMANSMGTIRSQLPGYGSHISGALAAGSGGLRALDRNMTADGQYLGSVWFNETGTHDKGNIAGDQIHYTYKGFASVLGADTGFRTGDSLVIIGGMISTSSMDSKGWNRITESRSTGSISGQSIGLYGSWFKNADDALSPFIDYTISYGKYDNTVTTLNNASSSYDSRLWTVSVQGGYPMAIGENLVVEPQAQISYIDYKVDNYRDFNGTDIREQQKGHVISRVGAYVYPKTGDVKPYAAFNLWYDDIASKVSYDDRSLSSGKPGLFYEAKLGVQAKMSENFTINSEINYRQGKHKHKNYNFNIGFKYQF
ncbi:autotransporter outer membrane beta-barrel domain-containing protein [Wohlfahrtiimonas chitiniclastica]|uniref:autotransporter outer membrane beta-barrel domain-containing protein n=1 Tax=Wohlfahrtiimonas chitiniclastica TaxID=400946 RepID=UPI000B98F7B9|nr:autotransporter outer membrane beta-barrel domain-containing protein [Wohlfahrtiimonas chitiniclastica]OYQ76222.1 hypothetical protein B9T18_02360 [Wohlfahrtiimonas chitiniclastica]